MHSRDQELETDFIGSWANMELFFERFLLFPSWLWLAPIIPFIQSLRKAGYNQKLRAGQSMTTFVLSQSVKHGLRSGQVSVRFIPQPDGQMIVSYSPPLDLPHYDIRRELTVESATLSDEIEGLLLRLLMQPMG